MINQHHSLLESGSPTAIRLSSDAMPAEQREHSDIAYKILAVQYQPWNKSSSKHSWSAVRPRIGRSTTGLVNTAYRFVRRILDSEEVSPVLISSNINETSINWANDNNHLLPTQKEAVDLDALKYEAIEQANALTSPPSLLSRIKATALYQSSPKEVQALLQAALPLPSVFKGARLPTFAFPKEASFTWEHYQAFLHSLHAICKQMELRKTLYDRNIRMPLKRFDALKELLANLFSICNRLLVIRVDLKYLERYAANIDFATHQLHIKKVFEAARSKEGVFKGCLGFALRMEDAPDTGLHCHMAFFFDGNHRSRDLYIAKQICDWWDQTVTGKKGLAWNVNQSWRKQIEERLVEPEDFVLGMVDRRDEEKVLKMVGVMRYLCHPGQDVLYKSSKNARTFLVQTSNEVDT